MARPADIRRGFFTTSPGLSQGTAILSSPGFTNLIGDGETLTQLWITWRMTDTTVPALNTSAPLIVAVGFTSGNPPPFPPSPLDNPNLGTWIWWERAPAGFFPVPPTSGSVVKLAGEPFGTIWNPQGQRKPAPGEVGDLFLGWHDFDTARNWVVEIGFSAVILLAA